MIPTDILYLFYLAATAIFAYRLYSIKSSRDLFSFAGITILALLIFAYEKADIQLLLSGSILFSAIISSYGKRRCYLFIALAVLYAWLSYSSGAFFILQSLFLGMLAGSHLSFEKPKRTKEVAELGRNAVQLEAGAMLIAAFALLKADFADAILFWLVILGSLLGNYALTNRKSKVSGVLYYLERDGAVLGSGARWLAIGALVAASFLQSDFVIMVFAAIFIADSFSTLVGMKLGGPRLPYNRKKSVSGTLAYLATVFLISAPFVGLIALPLAILAAFLESQPFHIDDNFDVSALLTLAVLVMLL